MNGKQLKNSILQWAIQGKLVPQDSNDEPASVLLEKIRQEKERLIKEKKIKRDKNASIIYRGEDNSYYEKILATGEVKCIDEEIPFEVPKGWEWTRIGNIFNHTSGKQQSSSNKGGGTPQKFITTSNLYWGHFILDNVKVMNFLTKRLRLVRLQKEICLFVKVVLVMDVQQYGMKIMIFVFKIMFIDCVRVLAVYVNMYIISFTY